MAAEMYRRKLLEEMTPDKLIAVLDKMSSEELIVALTAMILEERIAFLKVMESHYERQSRARLCASVEFWRILSEFQKPR
jgi:Mg/Co/Ni transporter MgtE